MKDRERFTMCQRLCLYLLRFGHLQTFLPCQSLIFLGSVKNPIAHCLLSDPYGLFSVLNLDEDIGLPEQSQ